MNLLTLIYFDGDTIRYGYQPEGKGKKGIIAYNSKDKTVTVEERAEADNNQYYANMAKSKIQKIATEKTLPRECVQAWY